MRELVAAHVLAVWAVVAVLALPEALLFAAGGPACVAANVFALFAALALLAHFSHFAPTHNAAYAVLPAQPPSAPSARAELTHVLLHVLCVAYVRAACWLEFRALLS